MSEEKTIAGSKRVLYKDVVEKAGLSLDKRKGIVPGRNGKMVDLRRYHMNEEKAGKVAAVAQSKGRFVAPFRRGGAYWGVVESLAVLGTNKRHLFKDVMEKMQEIMSGKELIDKSGKTAWEKFIGRSPRNEKNARDCVGKIVQNIEVLQRLSGLHPYGFKLVQMNACLNVYKKGSGGEDGVFIELMIFDENISANENGRVVDFHGNETNYPINERRTRHRKVKAVISVETDDKIVETIEVGENIEEASFIDEE